MTNGSLHSSGREPQGRGCEDSGGALHGRGLSWGWRHSRRVFLAGLGTLVSLGCRAGNWTNDPDRQVDGSNGSFPADGGDVGYIYRGGSVILAGFDAPLTGLLSVAPSALDDSAAPPTPPTQGVYETGVYEPGVYE